VVSEASRVNYIYLNNPLVHACSACDTYACAIPT